MATHYTASIQKPGDWWIGWVEEVPGVNSQGMTRKELLGNLRSALREVAVEEARTMIEQKFPPGWDERKVQELIADLDARTEDEWVAAEEAADDQAVVTVPASLLPEIRRLLATHKDD